MANRKISELVALTTPASGDYVPIVDISEVSTADQNKRITVEELFRGVPSGTAAAPSIAPESDPNSGIYSSGADQVSIATGGVERLRIDAAGQIEAVSLGTAAAPTFSFTTNSTTGLYAPGSDQLALSTGGVERVRIDISGNLLIGASTARTNFNNTTDSAGVQIEGTTPTTRRLSITSGETALSGGAIILAHQRSGTIGGNTILQQNDSFGAIGFDGSDGTDFVRGALILAEVDGTPGANDMPGRLAFWTTADGASTPTERLRITSAGNVGIGTSSPSSRLDVVSTIAGVAEFNGPANANIALNSDFVGLKLQCGSEAVFGSTTNHPTAFVVNNIERARITSAGNVGIGTSTPTFRFMVIAPAGAQDIFLAGQAGISNGYQISSTGSALTHIWNTAGGERLRLTDAGNVGIGTSSPDSVLHVLSPTGVAGFRVGYNGTSVNYYDADTQIFRRPSAAESLRITSTGNVGIGTSSPNGKLDVADGDAYITKNSGGDLPGVTSQSLYFKTQSGNLARLYSVSAGSGGPSGFGGDLRIQTKIDNGALADRLSIAYNGSVGIGTTSPSVALDVVAGIRGQALDATGTPTLFSSAGGGVLYHNGSGTAVLRAYSNVSGAAGNLTFNASGSENVRIDSSGRLLVGTSAARTNLRSGGATVKTQFETDATNDAFAFIQNGNAPNPSYLVLAHQRSGSSGGNGSLIDGDGIGSIEFHANDGTNFIRTAVIAAAVDGTPGPGDMPSRLAFLTTADGASTPTEAMRINNQRELLIGTTTRTANGGVLQISNGITFPGTQSACSDANTLDDYEEGTWTPTINTSNSDATITYSFRQAHYRKVGSLVFVAFWLEFRATSIGTGSDVRLNDLPFALSANSNRRMGAAAFGRSSGFVTTQPSGLYYIESATSSMFFASITPSNLNTAADMILYGQFSYAVA